MPKTQAVDVVLIHCHDLGRWLPPYGMPSVPAPALSAFAEESLVFDNAHSAAPLCSPARASLFTGVTPNRHGVQGLVHDAWRYRKGVSTAPERLRHLGYCSALVGLQHENVDPTVLGFDEVVGQGFLPRAPTVVGAAEDWLNRLAPRHERAPVFLTVGTWEVHRPWPADDYRHADPEKVDVPAYLPDNDDTRRDVAAFHGSIAQFDEAFGRLLRSIDETLPRESTMVVFTTDHGAAFPRAKSTLYDAGTGVAFIVRAPSSWGTSPRHIEQLVSHLDLVPTLVDLAGGSTEDSLEGISLLPLLQGRSGRSDRVLFTSKTYHDNYDPLRAARTLDHAYVRNYTDGPRLQLSADLEASATRSGMGDAHLEARPMEELYDRLADPAELTNVADRPEYQEIRRRLASELNSWLQDTGDPVATAVIEPAPKRNRHVDHLEPIPSTQPRCER